MAHSARTSCWREIYYMKIVHYITLHMPHSARTSCWRETALSVVGIVGRAMTFLCAVPGGYLGDRFGRINVIRFTALAGGIVPPLIFAFTTDFTVILLCTGVFGIVGGLGAASAAALQADVLPRDLDNASRDMQMINVTPGILPGIILPSLIGNMAGSFASMRQFYHVLFLSTACIYAVATALLFCIGIRPGGDAADAGAARSASGGQGRGAATCDRWCFTWENPRGREPSARQVQQAQNSK